ncbi:hypothetical protein BDD12DRAFT_539426 [Trichophaea hybrida]|nr:hypothetical protein BDD12DRAFT_539426 [Trichophaea hybrida]
MAAPDAICTALNLHNKQKCTSRTQSATSFFCAFHAKQVHGLYLGYKCRTAELTDLEKSPPKNLPKNFGVTDWSSFTSAKELKAIHTYLEQRYRLLNRCVTARDYHHSHFYGDNSDFGHQAFLDRLRTARNTVMNALGRLENRMLEVVYKNEQWMAWVQALQREEDQRHEAEKKKVKAEHALFRENQARIEALREEEEARRREKMEKEEVWDPIESIVEDVRGGYVALLCMLLRKEGVGEKMEEKALQTARELKMAENRGKSPVVKAGNSDETALVAFKEERENEGKGMVARMEDEQDVEFVARPIKIDIGGPEENRTGNTLDAEKLATLEDIEDLPMRELVKRMSRLASMERGVKSYNLKDREKSLAQVRRESNAIREYLLIRLITKNPALLGVALESGSINEFLHNPQVRNTDLRDLVLGLSNPPLQNIRDACADYWAGVALEKEAATIANQEEITGISPTKGKGKQLAIRNSPPGKTSTPKKSRKYITIDGEKIPISDPATQDQNDIVVLEERVKVCGRWIYNYPHERRLPRRGWFQFAMLTGCNLWKAIELCNSWDEFYELNILSLQGYFVGTNMCKLDDNETLFNQHCRRMGFIPYAVATNAKQATGAVQSGRHQANGRTHVAAEYRNYICAHIARDHPGARRFIAFAKAWCSEVVIWARDCKTGEIIADPPNEHKWLHRTKSGAGRLSKAKWSVIQEVGTKWKTEIDANRTWRFKFRECIDVVIWDRWPAQEFEMFASNVLKLLNKGFKIKDHLSVMETTFNVYEKCLVEEEGEDSPKTIEARKILQEMKAYRKTKTADEMKGKHPQMFYDDVDEEIDWAYGIYDNDPYWKRVDGDEVDNMYDLLQKIHDAPSQAVHDRLKLSYFSLILKGALRPKIYKDSDLTDTPKTPLLLANGKEIVLHRFPEIVDDDGDQEWEDDSEDDCDTNSECSDDIWQTIRTEAEELEEWATQFAEDIFDGQLKKNRSDYEKFEAAKKFTMDLAKKENINPRTRKKLQDRQSALYAGGLNFIPKNSVYCKVITEYLWGEDMRHWGEVEDSWEILKDWELRAQHPPPRRPRVVTDVLWKAWDDMVKSQGLTEQDVRDGDVKYPKDWDRIIRLTIAQLTKEEALNPSWSLSCHNPFVGGNPAKMYIDYRSLAPHIQPGPAPPDRYYLRQELQKFESAYPGTRYSFFRMRSSEYFWPRPATSEDTSHTALQDPQGRIWEWTKQPKDCPYSEYDMHDTLCMIQKGPPSIDRYDQGKTEMEVFTRVRIDQVLVMGGGKERVWLAAGYFRKRPVGCDIDWSRSFVGVTAGFLERLGEEWWD